MTNWLSTWCYACWFCGLFFMCIWNTPYISLVVAFHLIFCGLMLVNCFDKILRYIDLSNTRIKFSSIRETFFLLHCLMDIWWIEVFNFNSTKIIFLKFFFFLVLGKESLPVVMQIFFYIVFHLKLCFVIFHILNFALLGDWFFGFFFLYNVVFRDLFTWLPSCPNILY